uniref:interferon alpha-inducible protein 27-like protein 2A n=1 Tax=Pristiophorus japonicus TaxID=55135 RepID=UPI00398F12BB
MFHGTFGFFISYLLISSTFATTDEDDSCGFMEALPYIVVGGGAAALVGPAVVGLLGFTAKGIAAKSIAATMMKIGATLNGGGLAAGGVVSTLQSLGMKAGISAWGWLGAEGGKYFHKTFVCRKNKKSSKNE